MFAMSVLAHLGNEGLKSGKDVTPGQSCSLGVPRMLVFVSNHMSYPRDVHIPEDLEDLINLRVAGEKRLACAHLGEDASNRPHIYTSRVLATTEQNLRGAVP